MKYRLKIVPNLEPDADGHWITVEVERGPPHHATWLTTVMHFTPNVPSGYHIVAVDRLEQRFTPKEVREIER